MLIRLWHHRLRASCCTTESSVAECPSEVTTVGRDSEAAECADKAGKGNYLRLAIASSKADKHSLERQLPAALEFVSGHLAQQHRVLLHCDTGKMLPKCRPMHLVKARLTCCGGMPMHALLSEASRRGCFVW